jgi:hypothetical protein
MEFNGRSVGKDTDLLDDRVHLRQEWQLGDCGSLVVVANSVSCWIINGMVVSSGGISRVLKVRTVE